MEYGVSVLFVLLILQTDILRAATLLCRARMCRILCHRRSAFRTVSFKTLSDFGWSVQRVGLQFQKKCRGYTKKAAKKQIEGSFMVFLLIRTGFEGRKVKEKKN